MLMTLASQVAIALDNAHAYRQIESLNAGLEARVRERTAELEAVNAQLKANGSTEIKFLAHVSHELRTRPLPVSSDLQTTCSKDWSAP